MNILREELSEEKRKEYDALTAKMMSVYSRRLIDVNYWIKKPVFGTYEDLEDILKTAFGMYEDFKTALIHS
ncbi:hypothetical protein C804_02243 [Lachnospiraceae bacterium A4]|nr:hypothetical protein C804_02243 [Lachnospiraceae bacterium A4]